MTWWVWQKEQKSQRNTTVDSPHMHKVLTFPQRVTTPVEDGQVKEALTAQSDIT